MPLLMVTRHSKQMPMPQRGPRGIPVTDLPKTGKPGTQKRRSERGSRFNRSRQAVDHSDTPFPIARSSFEKREHHFH